MQHAQTTSGKEMPRFTASKSHLRLLKVGLFWGLCLGDLAGEALGDLLLRRLPPEALLPRRAHPRVPPEPTEAKDEHRSNSDGVLEVLSQRREED